MSRSHVRVPLRLVAATILFLFPAFLFAPRVFAVECPNGTEPLTAAKLSTAQISNPSATIGMCWKSDDTVVGQEAGEAKLWLQQHASKASNISCMDPQFAEKLKTFMQVVPGGIPTIISGYRPPEAQTSLVASGASKAGPCQSYHNYGLAADFSASPQTLQWMRIHSFEYGLAPTGVNPVTGCSSSGFCDYGHIQIGGSKTGQCGACSNYRGDGTLSGPTRSPTSELSDAIRRAMGQQPPMQPQQPLPPQPTLPAQPTLPEQPTSPTQNPTSTAQRPVTPVSDLINITNTNTNTNTRSTSSPTSTIDLINEFLDPVSDSIDIGKAVDIDLNPDTRDATSLDARKPTSTRVSATSSTYGNLNVPQTFTTNDLSRSPVVGYMVGENTFVLRMLDAMKNTLLLALSYLKPFGGYTQTQIYAE